MINHLLSSTKNLFFPVVFNLHIFLDLHLLSKEPKQWQKDVSYISEFAKARNAEIVHSSISCNLHFG